MGKLFLIYEGLSGAGKSTLLTTMMHRRNFSDYALHRGPASEWVYGTLNRNRKIDMPGISKFENNINGVLPTVFILVECNPTLALQRCKEKNDSLIEDLNMAFELFDLYYEKICQINYKLRVDTNGSLEESANWLEQHLQEIDNAYYN